MKRAFLSLLVVSLFFSYSLSAFEMVEIGKKVPDVKVVRDDGKVVSLGSFKGKVVLINFWATWCPPCVREMPDLNKLYSMLHKKGFEIVAIANPRDSVDRIRSFFKYNGIQFHYYMDQDFTAARVFMVRALPTTYVVDKNGIVKNRFVGARPWTSPQFLDYFNSLLKEGKKK